MLEKFAPTEQRYRELETLLADPNIISDQAQYQKLAKEFSDMTPLVTALAEYRQILRQMNDLKGIFQEKHDKDFEDLAKAELKDLEDKEQKSFKKIKDLETA